MKKIAIFFCMVLVFANIFAVEKGKKENSTDNQESAINKYELTVTPSLGLSASTLPLSEGIQISIKQFDLGVNATIMGMPIISIKELTTILNLDIGVGGSIPLGPLSVTLEKSISLYVQALEGYTFKPLNNLYITPAIGLGFGHTTFKNSDYNIGSPFIISIPVYASAKYFFTDSIGIEGTILNSFGFGLPTKPEGNFINTFVLKIGPVFKL